MDNPNQKKSPNQTTTTKTDKETKQQNNEQLSSPKTGILDHTSREIPRLLGFNLLLDYDPARTVKDHSKGWNHKYFD